MRVIMIRKLCLFLLAFSFLAADCLATEPVKSQLVIPETEYNFGEVSEGTVVEHQFVLKNQGNAPLSVERVVASCGCTAGTIDSNTIAPGEEGKLKVSFDTKGFFGEKLKTVRVYTNDSDTPMTVLSLKGVIKPDIEIIPPRILFEDVVKGEPSPVQELQLRVRKGAGAEIGKVQTYSKYIALTPLEETAGEKRFSVSVLPDAPAGELRERIVVGISGGKVSSMNVPVFAIIKGKLRLKPSRLSFGIIEGSTLKRTVKLVNRGKAPVKIIDISSKNEAVKTSVKEEKPGHVFSIEVSIDPTLVEDDVSESIVITTDSEEEPALTLNIYGILPSGD